VILLINVTSQITEMNKKSTVHEQ